MGFLLRCCADQQGGDEGLAGKGADQAAVPHPTPPHPNPPHFRRFPARTHNKIYPTTFPFPQASLVQIDARKGHLTLPPKIPFLPYHQPRVGGTGIRGISALQTSGHKHTLPLEPSFPPSSSSTAVMLDKITTRSIHPELKHVAPP